MRSTVKTVMAGLLVAVTPSAGPTQGGELRDGLAERFVLRDVAARFRPSVDEQRCGLGLMSDSAFQAMMRSAH